MAGARLARISHRFLLNSYNWLDNNELWGSAKYGLFLGRCSAETSKRQAREAVLSLRSAWSPAVVSGLMNCTSQAVAILRPEQGSAKGTVPVGTAPWVRTPLGRKSALFACE